MISPWISFASASPVDISWTSKSVVVRFCQFLRVILRYSGLLLILSFYSSLSLFSVNMSSNPSLSPTVLKELMNIYILSLLAFHPHASFSPLPRVHISWRKLDYHTIKLSLTDILVHILVCFNLLAWIPTFPGSFLTKKIFKSLTDNNNPNNNSYSKAYFIHEVHVFFKIKK